MVKTFATTYAEAVKRGHARVNIKEEKEEEKEEKAKEDDNANKWKEVESKQAKKAAKKKAKEEQILASTLTPMTNGERRKSWNAITTDMKCTAGGCKRETGNRYKCGGCKDR